MAQARDKKPVPRLWEAAEVGACGRGVMIRIYFRADVDGRRQSSAAGSVNSVAVDAALHCGGGKNGVTNTIQVNVE